MLFVVILMKLKFSVCQNKILKVIYLQLVFDIHPFFFIQLVMKLSNNEKQSVKPET
jgi:hypothetical protein